tara:strand:- start:2113 stop:2280 length:168 start_codon:yes stop_codon:yes gene_type:complete
MFNNTNINDFQIWLDDNDDQLYCMYHETGARYDTVQEDYYEDHYNSQLTGQPREL